jgi:DNA recombination protein RmuC
MLEGFDIVVGLLLGLGLGALCAQRLLAERARAPLAAAEVRLEEQRRSLAEQRQLLQEDRGQLEHAFKALSADALKRTNEEFLKLAEAKLKQADGDAGKRQEAFEGLVKPLGEKLQLYDQQLRALEEARAKEHASLGHSLQQLAAQQQALQKETGTLANALRNPQVRGRWGELALQRAVELAGMTEHCDFVAQAAADGEDGALRPDLVVNLPSERCVVIDAKAPVGAYLDYLAAASEEARQAALDRYVRAVRAHMRQLAGKAYQDRFATAPEFVVMFIPGEAFFSAALEADPSLLEDAVQERVILATPTTLIALLRAVATGWRQASMAANAQRISELGRDLHDRLLKLTEHVGNVGDRLGKTVKAYNDLVGSYESRVLASARRFQELGAAGEEELGGVEPVVLAPRAVHAPRPEDVVGR